MEQPKPKYDLLERTASFSLAVRDFCLQLKRDIINLEYIKQIVRSAGSVAANYIEANENLGPNDFKYRIKICRKEVKETRLWLNHLLTYEKTELEPIRLGLIKESIELENIFGAIYRKIV